MSANIKTNTVVKESTNAAVDSVSRVTLTGMAIVSALVGIWAAACLVSAFVLSGPGEMIRGFISAVSGV